MYLCSCVLFTQRIRTSRKFLTTHTQFLFSFFSTHPKTKHLNCFYNRRFPWPTWTHLKNMNCHCTREGSCHSLILTNAHSGRRDDTHCSFWRARGCHDVSGLKVGPRRAHDFDVSAFGGQLENACDRRNGTKKRYAKFEVRVTGKILTGR